MFRFCIVSIFCVYVTTSTAFAHPDPGDGFHFATTRGIELRVGGAHGETFIGHLDASSSNGDHIHRYRYTIFLKGATVGLIWELTFPDLGTEPDPDAIPEGYWPSAGGDDTPVDPPANYEPPQFSHSHDVTHQHGSYVSHTHTVTHVGDSWRHTHSYTQSEIHDLVGNDHSGIGTSQQRGSGKGGSPGGERGEGRIGPPPGYNPPQSQSHSHSITHQHGSYVSHTHIVTHTGEASGHTHSYTQSEIHDLVGNNHAGVGTSEQNNEREGGGVGPPPGNNNQGEPPGGTSNGATTTTVATPVVGGTPEGTSSPQQVVSSGPQETQSGAPPARLPLQPLRVTEYMVRDWSKGGVWSGNSNLPQWIELHNPNIEAVTLRDYTFQYATRFFANYPYTIHTLTLAATEEGFSIPGGGVAVLVTHDVPSRRFSGIEATHVYNLDIENVLKRGWVLTDADGKEVQRIGRDAFSALRDPVAPRHQDGARVSYQVYRSEAPSEPYYYGHSGDIGSPGFYKQPAPAAPSVVRRKRVGTWAGLKQTP